MADIVDIAVSTGTFSTFIALLDTAGMLAMLKEPGPFTVFAPKDSAFTRFPAGTVENLLQNLPQLRRVLACHIATGRIVSTGIKGKHTNALTMMEGEHLAIVLSPSGHLQVNNALVTRTDILADNGVIHVIDNVILPSTS